MKVVRISNYNDETVAERVIGDIDLTEAQAQAHCDVLNKALGDNSYHWHVVKPDDYIAEKLESVGWQLVPCAIWVQLLSGLTIRKKAVDRKKKAR